MCFRFEITCGGRCPFEKKGKMCNAQARDVFYTFPLITMGSIKVFSREKNLSKLTQSPLGTSKLGWLVGWVVGWLVGLFGDNFCISFVSREIFIHAFHLSPSCREVFFWKLPDRDSDTKTHPPIPSTAFSRDERKRSRK